MSDLLLKLADAISPKSCFVVEGPGLERLTLREAIGSYLRSGINPMKSSTVLVASGGSSKGYFTEGFLEVLVGQGVVLDRVYTTSVTSLLSLTEFHDLATLRDFSRQIPELIRSRITRGLLRKEGAAVAEFTEPVTKATGALVRGSLHYVGSMVPFSFWSVNNAKGGHAQNGNAALSTRTNYLFDTTAFDERLQKLCKDERGRDRHVGDLKKFNIVAVDYRDRRTYVLNNQYPDMLLWVAIRGSMALPQLIKPTIHVDPKGVEHPIFDGGISNHFPYFDKEINKKDRVIGVILGFHSGPQDSHDYSGNRGTLKDMIAQAEIRNFETITTAMRRDYLLELDTGVNHQNPKTERIMDPSTRIYLSLPHNPESPSFTIHIPPSDRETIYQRGREEAFAILSQMRRPYAFPDLFAKIAPVRLGISTMGSSMRAGMQSTYGAISRLLF